MTLAIMTSAWTILCLFSLYLILLIHLTRFPFHYLIHTKAGYTFSLLFYASLLLYNTSFCQWGSTREEENKRLLHVKLHLILF